MPNIPQVKISGTTYDIKDNTARNQISTLRSDLRISNPATFDKKRQYLGTNQQGFSEWHDIEVDKILNVEGVPADGKATGDAIIAALERAVHKPLTDKDGEQGQLLMSNGDGTTTWTDAGTPSQAEVGEAVENWLDEHPEATTTVQDGSISLAKLTPELTGMIGSFGVNVVSLGVLPTDAQSVALQKINEIISRNEYSLLFIPPEIDYGYSAKDNIKPYSSNVTKRLVIIDMSRDATYGTEEEAYDGMQLRMWFFTPNETNGQHDGNGFFVEGNYHPYIKISNNGDQSDSNYSRSSLIFAEKNKPVWQLATGVYNTDKDFHIARYLDDGSGSVLFVIGRQTGNMCVGANYLGFELGIFKKPVYVIADGSYLTVMDTTASTKQFLYQRRLTSTGENVYFNGKTAFVYNLSSGSPQISASTENGYLAVEFNKDSGLTVTNVGRTASLFTLKNEGLFTRGVSGNGYRSNQRPTVTTIGTMIFDTTIGKPIWWSGSKWVDATGAAV